MDNLQSGKGIFTKKEYIITLVLNVVCFLLWFTPAIQIGSGRISTELALGEMKKMVELPFMDVLGILYTVFAIAGIIMALIPLVMNLNVRLEKLSYNLQGAPMLQLVVLLLWYFFAKIDSESSYSILKVSFTFGGIMMLIVTIAATIWYFGLVKKYNKFKKAEKATNLS